MNEDNMMMVTNLHVVGRKAIEGVVAVHSNGDTRLGGAVLLPLVVRYHFE